MKINSVFSILIFISLLSQNSFSQTIINLQKENGVFTVPCTVNGLPLRFILDTGASEVTISLTEAEFMIKNHLLSSEDLIATQTYQTANGRLSEGVKVILREIKFGDILMTNIVATIVLSDNAPLLLGQSVLSRIGKFQIDPLKNTLTIDRVGNTTPTSVTDIDGNVYSIVKIGEQNWINSNLKVTKFNNGEAIPNISVNSLWVTADYGSFCYYENDKTPSTVYGNLYNWYAIIDGRGLCPFGWHVPSKSDFMKLNDYLKNIGVLSGALKATTNWQTPNIAAVNFAGFNSMPGGKRWHNSGDFEFIDAAAFYWTSSSNDISSAFYYAFSKDYDVARISTFMRNDGFSCRCIKD